MAASEAKLDRFDHLVPAEPWANPWQADGKYLADEDLLARLLSVAVGTAQPRSASSSSSARTSPTPASSSPSTCCASSSVNLTCTSVPAYS